MEVTKDKFIKLSKDFSEYPGVRLASVSEHSAEEFYYSILKLAFIKVVCFKGRLTIDLDGTAGLAVSFLDGVFGTLARDFGICTVFRHLTIISNDEPELLEDIKGYIIECNL